MWLSKLGAKVHGYSLIPPTTLNFFSETQLEKRIEDSVIGDIRDLSKLTSALQTAKPSIVIHMAAQPLVRESYVSPVVTFSTNVIGTVNVLEAVRSVDTVEAVVNITTDKCYENQEWVWPYRENDRLGGRDAYSSSKACAELAAAAYRSSFLAEAGIQLASVRAGNVIGGGDWATDRLIPDFLRAVDEGEPLSIRSPNAIRPWQHVLEPLSGYLLLAERLVTEGAEFAEGWNFGPEEADAKPVSWILDRLCQKIPSANWVLDRSPQPHEASVLKLDSVKAKTKLNWAPRWSLDTALDNTVEWYQLWREGQSMAEASVHQIEAYQIA
ncbi:MAG: CDP-glucose 4,6-dehydratase [Gammaproteobacteria bacterium]|nr:MAG: CDP-glucose 4,6-dehydratase [Gammaproteobacteria bacterium]